MSSPDEPAAPRLVRRAIATDVAFIMSTERMPGYDALVASWTSQQHALALADSTVEYLIIEAPVGEPAGFAILEGLGDLHQGVKLKRIALTRPGYGLGAAFLDDIQDWVFTRSTAARLWLDVFVSNERARRAYRRAGLSEDGLLRQAYVLPSGERVDRVIMSILRSEWERR